MSPFLPVFFWMAGLLTPFQTCAAEPESDDYKVLKEIIVLEFSKEAPHEWGAVVPGVRTRLKTEDKVVAVTLEGAGQDGVRVDEELLDLLAKENIPATVFVSGKWLDKNPAAARKLAQNPVFEIANLGLEAKSCSVNGESASGIPATKNAEEVFAEIEMNARKIESLTGMLPRFFRAGAAFYDDVAVRIARALGYEVVGSNITVEQTAGRASHNLNGFLLTASAGSIAAIPLESPAPGMAGNLKQAVSKLRAKGFQFVRLGDYPLE